jgi:glycosyltransferase involved in cell wall biosynthesis/peptidoglycan/xylan/chitin deacetylase (PgdA/CDA1 family)
MSAPGGLVLMYHRINEVRADPFSLNVTPCHFAEQLEVLRGSAVPVRLADITGAGQRAIALTFDDGYADNLLHAAPLLAMHDIPATVFVTSGFVDSARELWWDELERIFLEPGGLPEQLRLQVRGCDYRWATGDSTRPSLYKSVWRLLQLLADAERREILDRLAEWAGIEHTARPSYRGVTGDELRQLASSGLIDIGGHTMTHPALPELSAAGQRQEIRAPKARIESILGRPIESFAYPYGAHSGETVDLVRQAGFQRACTTVPGLVQPHTDPFRLPRVQVEDWDGEEFARRLEAWFTAQPWSAIWSLPESPAEPELAGGKWDLRVAPENAARLSLPDAHPDAVRIEIQRAATPYPYDIQLNHPRVAVEAGKSYEVSFRARADSPRSLAVGCARAHDPWDGLGLYDTIDLTPQWQDFRLDFVGSATDAVARIHFDAGASDVSLEIAAVSLRTAAPSVSVVIPFFNAAKFMREAIDSVIAQTHRDWELMLVDDGSTDGGTEIAQSYAAAWPGRIVYLAHEQRKNRGACASRNLGIRHCRGKYIAFLDADDAWLPHKLARQVSIMQAHPRAGMVCGASRYWHCWTGDSADRDRDYVQQLGIPADTLYDPPALLTLLYPFGEGTTPPPTDFMVRRDVLESVGGFEEEFLGVYQLHEDQALLLKLYWNASIYISAEEWDKYRIHPASCDSRALGDGRYWASRAFLLRWLEAYLRKHRIADPRIWQLLRIAVQDARLQLRAESGAVARVVQLHEHSGCVRVEIQAAPSGLSTDLQLNLPFYRIHGGHRYALAFQARSDQPRTAFVGVAAAHAPWTGLGLYGQIQADPQWRAFRLEFTATADDDDARIHFDLGDSAISLELRDLELRTLPEGQLIEPSLTAIEMSHVTMDR